MQLRLHLESLNSEESEWHDHIIEYGISERRMAEVFCEEYGITPKVYMDQMRLKEAERLQTETEEKVIDIAESADSEASSPSTDFSVLKPGRLRRITAITHRQSGE